MTTEQIACCACLTVQWTTVKEGNLTKGWWQCKDCGNKFVPAAMIQISISEIRAELAERDERITSMEAAIEADRTKVIDVVNVLDKILNGKFWLTEGRGSYEWNDDRYREEFHAAVVDVLSALKPLRKLGADLTNCPATTAEVIAARRDKDAKIDALQRELDAARADEARKK